MKSTMSAMFLSCLSLVCVLETCAMIPETRSARGKTVQRQKASNNKQSNFDAILQSSVSQDQDGSTQVVTEAAAMDLYDMLAKYALTSSAAAACILMALCALFGSDK